MNCGKDRREYLKNEIQRCEEKLISLKDDPARYDTAVSYVQYLKHWYKIRSIKDVDNSVTVHATMVELIDTIR